MQFNTQWVKDMNMQFTEKEIQRANMEMLRFTQRNASQNNNEVPFFAYLS